jgi:HEAT repeat protein
MDKASADAPGYTAPANQLLSLGEAKDRDFTFDYTALGIEPAHVPDLLRMVADEELHDAPQESPRIWAPVHAWRALAQLKAESAVGPLLGLLRRIDERDDNWVSTEVPLILGMLGQAALEPVTAYLADPAHDEWALVAAAQALGEIGTRHPESRAECVARLTAQLEKHDTQSGMVNAFLVTPLLDLEAVGSLPVMARAFDAGHVDESVVGDYEDAEIALGLKMRRLHPPKPNELTELGEHLRAIAADDLVETIMGDEAVPEAGEPHRSAAKVGRNDPCPCDSGKKFKKCCGA